MNAESGKSESGSVLSGGFTASEMNGLRNLAKDLRKEREAPTEAFLADVDRLLRQAQQDGHINRHVRGVLKHLINGAVRTHFGDERSLLRSG